MKTMADNSPTKLLELATATFSLNPIGKQDRYDRWRRMENGEFFLAHDGFVTSFAKYGEKFMRPATGQPRA